MCSKVAGRFGHGTVAALLAVAVGVLLAGGLIGGAGPAADAGTVTGQQAADPDAATEQLVVRFDPPAADGSRAALEAHAEKTQAAFLERYADDPAVEILERFWVANAVLVEVRTDRIDPATLERGPGVIRVHGNFDVQLAEPSPAASPGAPAAPERSTASRHAYGVEMVGAPEVWEQFDTRGEGATVAVLDTGVDPGRADLSVEEWAEFDADGERVSSTPHDPHGHGTHVAGTVVGDDASGTAIGVAPGATLYGVKVTDDNSTGTFAQILSGIEWATARDDVDVVQVSLGTTGTFPAYHEPVRNALAAGTVVVAASGNDGVETSSSPGNLYDVLSVGAVGQNRQVPPFSSGQQLDTAEDWHWRGSPPEHWPASYVVPTVTAPGVAVPSAQAGSETALSLSSGTSMAAPHVAGVAALAVAAADDPDSGEVVDAIRDTSVSPHGSETPDDRYGHGIVDAPGAVEALTGTAGGTATFDVEVVDTNSPVAAGSELAVRAVVTNTGSGTGTQEVALDVDGIGPIDVENVTLEAGDSREVTLRWQTPADSEGEFTATVRSEDDADSQTVAVSALEPARFEVDRVEFDDRVTAGDKFEVVATITNTGDVQGYQAVELAVDGHGTVDAEGLLLDAGGSGTVTLRWQTGGDDTGPQAFSVSSFDDERAGSMSVETPPGESDDRPDRDESSGIVLVLVMVALATVAMALLLEGGTAR